MNFLTSARTFEDRHVGCQQNLQIVFVAIELLKLTNDSDEITKIRVESEHQKEGLSIWFKYNDNVSISPV